MVQHSPHTCLHSTQVTGMPSVSNTKPNHSLDRTVSFHWGCAHIDQRAEAAACSPCKQLGLFLWPWQGAGSWLEAQQGRQAAGRSPGHTCSWCGSCSAGALAGSSACDLPARLNQTGSKTQFYKDIRVAQRHAVTLSLKPSPGLFSEPEEEKSIGKQQICNIRKKSPAAEVSASTPHRSCLLRKGSAATHSPLHLPW